MHLILESKLPDYCDSQMFVSGILESRLPNFWNSGIWASGFVEIVESGRPDLWNLVNFRNVDISLDICTKS